ncbi:MAG: response regulator [Stenomitos frigidus ULC029]
MKILLIESDDSFVKVLTKTLKAHHYIIDVVKDGEMGWTYGSTFEYDLMIMDIVLPKLDGISLCKRFRAEGYVTPILLLTAQTANAAMVQGLDAGADDYVVKPFDQAELAARMRALLRRGSPNPYPLLTWGDLMLNPSTCEVSYRSQRLDLTTKEYELLELLLRDSQHVFSSGELLDHLWSSEKFPSEATVRSHIRRVRHKLGAIGAPQDFIATLHGRGYYLKAPQAEAVTPTPLSQRSPSLTAARTNIDPHDSTPSLPAVDRSTAAQQQHLAFLNETWTTTQPDSIDQVKVLLQAIEDLHADQLTTQHQIQAQQLAHKLAGTLNIFGLHKAVHLTRQLEHWLGGQAPLPANQAPLMKGLVRAIQQEIEATTQIECHSRGHSLLLLLLSDDEPLNHALQAIAASRGIQVELMSPLVLDTTLTALDAAIDEIGQSPDIILLHLSADRSVSRSSGQTQLSSLLQRCTQHYPSLPIVVMGDRQEWRDRLDVVRQGGKLFLDASIPPEQVIATVVDSLTRSQQPTKVMIVDDDHHWLRTLPTLLKPWGFKVTTLADPQQFWTVLQAVAPDVVVLDVNLPEINGFELCQMLRSDPDWQRLPVLFLSALTDASSQQQAFTVGADDYLHKPLMGGELATRILNRLQRVQAYQG